jgi:Tol biopolymer transport system component
MALATGTHLGSYEILAPIGAGGMGEVYQAHDTKLGRHVAIKVLPEAFAHDPERLSRFQREAKMLAALNHPNIATIYGLEQSNGTSYLVMELVSGETLAERIKREGAVPIEESLKIAVQIAEALEAAHEKGIIHRDLKPANVKVTPEGKVKVLDFGLAKAFAGDTTNEDPSNSPTLSMAVTMHGVILGTAAYMSPEQARGKAVDKRTDIWAFGCVLYELLCGRPAFGGEDVTEILAAVVKTEPEWTRLPEATPPAIHILLRRCLRKDKRQRLQDAVGVRIEIEDAIAAPKNSGATQAAPSSTSKLLLAVGAVAAALAIIAIVMAWGWWRATRPIEQSLRPLVRLDVDLGPDVSLDSAVGADEIISSDGTRIVYVSLSRLFTRRLDQANATELAGTQGAFMPFFSPDGQWVAFFTQGKLQKISVEGGSAITLCDATNARGGSWGEDGNIIAALNTTSGLSRIPSAGGPPTPVTDLQNGEQTHRWPQILPRGQAVLFSAGTTTRGFDGANSGQRLVVDVTEGSGVDIWVYDWQRDTMTRATFTGSADHPVWSPDGRYIAFQAPAEGLSVIRSDGSGKPQPLTQSKNFQIPYSFAPDGKRLAFMEVGSGGYDLWTVPLESDGTGLRAGKPEVFLQTQADERWPSFSPDGRWMAYASTESGTSQVYVRAFPDKGAKWQISNSGGKNPMWSRNGRELFFETLDNHIMVAAYAVKGDSFLADKPRMWSEKQLGGDIGAGRLNVDLAPDGKRIAALMPVETAEGQKAQNHVIFLENFFDEVRRRTATQAK